MQPATETYTRENVGEINNRGRSVRGIPRALRFERICCVSARARAAGSRLNICTLTRECVNTNRHRTYTHTHVCKYVPFPLFRPTLARALAQSLALAHKRHSQTNSALLCAQSWVQN